MKEMNPVIEQALRLPREEKLELFYALQEELEAKNEEDFFSDDLMEELKKREQAIDEGRADFISMETFNTRLQNLRNELRSKRS